MTLTLLTPAPSIASEEQAGTDLGRIAGYLTDETTSDGPIVLDEGIMPLLTEALLSYTDDHAEAQALASLVPDEASRPAFITVDENGVCFHPDQSDTPTTCAPIPAEKVFAGVFVCSAALIVCIGNALAYAEDPSLANAFKLIGAAAIAIAACGFLP